MLVAVAAAEKAIAEYDATDAAATANQTTANAFPSTILSPTLTMSVRSLAPPTTLASAATWTVVSDCSIPLSASTPPPIFTRLVPPSKSAASNQNISTKL